MIETDDSGARAAAEAETRLTRRILALACVVSSCLVALDLWAYRDLFDADALSYIDVADAYSNGRWRDALVGVWSPLYAWLLGLMMFVFEPSAQWEYTAVHVVNYVIYLAALASFTVFMRAFLRTQHEGQGAGAPDWAWLLFGYSLFTWSVIRLIPPHQPQPDLAVCAWVYLILAMILRVRADGPTWRTSILLGVLLGLAYLTKGVMFPMAFVFLGVMLMLAPRSSRSLTRVLAALAVFLVVSLPYVFALSRAHGRMMFNDAGRLNYAWEINEVKKWNHWQGGDGHGTPVHPTRMIQEDPPVYEFGGTPFPDATYPPWYDPSYWYDGVEPSRDLGRQFEVIIRNAGYLFSFLVNNPGALTGVHDAYNLLDYENEETVGALFALLCALLLVAPTRAVVRAGAANWFLLVPVGAALAAYAMLHYEGRYIAAYVVVLWLVLFRSATPLRSAESKKAYAAVLASLALIIGLTVTIGTSLSAAGAARYFVNGGTEAPVLQSGHSHWKVATYLRGVGVREGDPVGGVGWVYYALWARMARLHIVAEVPTEGAGAFWALDSARRAETLQLFRRLGAKAVVANDIPVGIEVPEEWHRVGDTGMYVFVFGASEE